ncbi:MULTISPECIES: hypothetical protein [Brucella]|uniref:Uncharacterized protein n=1 Tax=Brucella anthropi TaxID=529 RepID=A0A6I0DPB3_BRUAN|nr:MULTISPECIES: hypothetical protein [Brucella]KAB2792271.1 hypothetical protein F9L06_22095 [Brucella anthropi]MDX4076059.1 hypothetical protein [Brucella sp. NBRC 113783]
MNALAFPGFAPDPAQAASIRLRVLSLGAGVQSTMLALMAAHGEIGPMPDCAIFADTGWEPKAVYEHLAWLRSPIRTGFRGILGEVYLHRSAVPLDQADLSTAADHGQLDLWPNECEGMCGV